MRRAFLGLLTAALCLASVPASAKPPVWIVRDKDSTIILFGSVHVLPAGLDWMPQQLADALPKADDLWFEIPITAATQQEAATLVQSLGPFPSTDNLSNHLTPAEGQKLRRVADKLSLSLLALDRMRPWLAELMLSNAMDMRVGASATEGVEEKVQALAPPTAHRRAFETTREQIGFLAGAPMDTQVASLDETLSEIEDRPETYGKVVEDWRAGDIAALKADALDPLRDAAPVLYQRLIVERNARWTRTIQQRLAGHGVTVIVVGAGHLIGPDGVPAMLRARGLTVEGP